jgi:hypothetical protein
MHHAEAHERLADLALEPGRLARLDDDRSPEAAALRTHLAACERCATDLAGWRRTWAEVGRAVGGGTAPAAEARRPAAHDWVGPDLDPSRAPESLRARTMAAIAAEGRSPGAPGQPVSPPSQPALPIRLSSSGPARIHSPRWLPWLAAAAALLIAVGAGTLGLVRSSELDQARAQGAELTAVASTLNRVLADPEHWTATLRAADGTVGGTLAWSSSDMVVIATGLPTPGARQGYRCWVEQDGVRTPIGSMSFSGSTGYWAGGMTGWTGALASGARFGVSLVPDGGEGTPVLIGEL